VRTKRPCGRFFGFTVVHLAVRDESLPPELPYTSLGQVRINSVFPATLCVKTGNIFLSCRNFNLQLADNVRHRIYLLLQVCGLGGKVATRCDHHSYTTESHNDVS
jgi:hypothetical protein